MAYFPNKQAIKTELQETTNKFDLSTKHLTSCNFFEPNVAYIRDNTTREDWINNTGIFARPMPMQMPVMGSAKLSLKTFFVPYRVISPQWNNFNTRSPHIPANGNTPIIVQEMPYFKMSSLKTLFTTTMYATPTTGTTWDFRRDNGTTYILTAWGRHCMKILHQLGYKILWGKTQTTEKHWNALRILAFAKAYMDFYYTSQYAYVTSTSANVEKLFTKDNTTAYELTQTDFSNIFEVTRWTFYTDDYFISQWDNPVSPNNVASSFGTLTMQDITAEGTTRPSQVTNYNSGGGNQYNPLGTPLMELGVYNGHTSLTQYALDSLKMVTDYAKRYSIAGIRAVDRYLARFGVLLTAEKMKRCEYYGEQTTQMQFGAIFSTAETQQGSVGDYAGQGVINSEGQPHNEFEMNDLKEQGCIIQIFTITPDIGYCQGIDRNNMRTDPESYFNGIFDSLGTQATSTAELYVSEDGQGLYSDEPYSEKIFGYIARGAHWKVAQDKLTGDFMFNSMNNGNYKTSPWHMFRMFDDTYFSNINQGNANHSPAFVQAIDAEQYLRIFNTIEEESGDHFVVLITQKIDANLHAKNLYDTYDFESEGKEIILNGMGPKAN